MHSSTISKRGRSSEEEWFRRTGAARREERERADLRAAGAAELAAALGLAEPARAEALIDLGLRPDQAAAFAVLPLVEVAWADGSVAADERWRILEAATRHGVELGGPAHALLEYWLDTRPAAELFRAWHALAVELEVAAGGSRGGLAEAAASVARAAGGVLGFGPVSRAERRALAAIEHSLAGGSASGASEHAV